MNSSRIAKLLSGACVVLLAFGLAFRAFVYARIPIAPGEPHGFADLIEFVLGWALVGILALSLLAAGVLLVRGPRPSRIMGAWLAAVCIAVAVFAGPLHTQIAVWAKP